MEYIASNLKVQKQLISSENILFIQDIDGVCDQPDLWMGTRAAAHAPGQRRGSPRGL